MIYKNSLHYPTLVFLGGFGTSDLSDCAATSYGGKGRSRRKTMSDCKPRVRGGYTIGWLKQSPKVTYCQLTDECWFTIDGLQKSTHPTIVSDVCRSLRSDECLLPSYCDGS